MRVMGVFQSGKPLAERLGFDDGEHGDIVANWLQMPKSRHVRQG
jgi:hypothetical protein